MFFECERFGAGIFTLITGISNLIMDRFHMSFQECFPRKQSAAEITTEFWCFVLSCFMFTKREDVKISILEAAVELKKNSAVVLPASVSYQGIEIFSFNLKI